MVTPSSAANAKLCLVVCIVAIFYLGCCAAHAPVDNSASLANGTGILLAKQSDIVSNATPPHPNNRVYNMYTLHGKRYSYNALIQIKYEGSNQPVDGICTGSLISNRHVLTAGHCCISVEEAKNINKLIVTVGASLLNENTLSLGTGGHYGQTQAWVGLASGRYVPPGYHDRATNVVDLKWGVCVLVLNGEVPKAIASTANLNAYMIVGSRNMRTQELPIGAPTHTYGWGSQSNFHPLQPSKELLGLSTSSVSCGDGIYAGIWEPFRGPPGLEKHYKREVREGAPYFICTEGSLGSGAVCKNDDGGPLIRTLPGTATLYDLVGVFVYKIGGNHERCVEDMNADDTGGRNLNIYVNTMAGQIYSFIKKVLKET